MSYINNIIKWTHKSITFIMKHSFLQTLSITFSSKIGKSIILAIFVMLTGSPTFGQARRGTTQKANTTTVTKPSPNLVNDFNKKSKIIISSTISRTIMSGTSYSNLLIQKEKAVEIS